MTPKTLKEFNWVADEGDEQEETIEEAYTRWGKPLFSENGVQVNTEDLRNAVIEWIREDIIEGLKEGGTTGLDEMKEKGLNDLLRIVFKNNQTSPIIQKWAIRFNLTEEDLK